MAECSDAAFAWCWRSVGHTLVAVSILSAVQCAFEKKWEPSNSARRLGVEKLSAFSSEWSFFCWVLKLCHEQRSRSLVVMLWEFVDRCEVIGFFQQIRNL